MIGALNRPAFQILDRARDRAAHLCGKKAYRTMQSHYDRNRQVWPPRAPTLKIRHLDDVDLTLHSQLANHREKIEPTQISTKPALSAAQSMNRQIRRHNLAARFRNLSIQRNYVHPVP